MSRYIDADTLEEKAKQYSLGYYEADEWAVPLCEISEAPSIDIEPKRGRWINEHEDGHGSWVGTCTQCNKENRVDNFCPHCGADMRGKDDE